MEIPKGLFQNPAPGIQAMTLDTPEGATQINALATWKLFLLDELDTKNQSLLDLVSGAGLRAHDPGIVHRVEIVESQIKEYLTVNEGFIQIEPVTDAHEVQVRNLFRRVAYNFIYQGQSFPSMKEIIETEITNNDGTPEACRNSMASVLTDPDELGNFYSTVINSNHLDRSYHQTIGRTSGGCAWRYSAPGERHRLWLRHIRNDGRTAYSCLCLWLCNLLAQSSVHHIPLGFKGNRGQIARTIPVDI